MNTHLLNRYEFFARPPAQRMRYLLCLDAQQLAQLATAHAAQQNAQAGGRVVSAQTIIYSYAQFGYLSHERRREAERHFPQAREVGK